MRQVIFLGEIPGNRIIMSYLRPLKQFFFRRCQIILQKDYPSSPTCGLIVRMYLKDLADQTHSF